MYIKSKRCGDAISCLLCVGKTTGIPIHVFGTETHMTAIVGMALGQRPIDTQPQVAAHTANFLLNTSGGTTVSDCVCVWESLSVLALKTSPSLRQAIR